MNEKICPVCEKFLDMHWIATPKSKGYYTCPKGCYSITNDTNDQIYDEYICYKNYMIFNHPNNTCAIQEVSITGIPAIPLKITIINGHIRYSDNFEEIIMNHLILA